MDLGIYSRSKSTNAVFGDLPMFFEEAPAGAEQLQGGASAPAPAADHLQQLAADPRTASHPWVQQNVANSQRAAQGLAEVRAGGHEYEDRGVLSSAVAAIRRAGLTAQSLALNAAKTLLPQSMADDAIGREMQDLKQQQEQYGELYGMSKSLKDSATGMILSGVEQAPANIGGMLAMGGVGYPVFAGLSTFGEYKFQGEEAITKAEKQLGRALSDAEKTEVRDRFSGAEAMAGAATETVMEKLDMMFGVFSKILPQQGRKAAVKVLADVLKDPKKMRPLLETAKDSAKGLAWEVGSEGLLQSGPQAAIGRDLEQQTEQQLGVTLGKGGVSDAYLKGAKEGGLAAVGMWGVGAPLSVPGKYSDEKLKQRVSEIVADPAAPVPQKLQAIEEIRQRVGKISKTEADAWADQMLESMLAGQQQAAAGSGQTAAPGGEQGAGQFVAGAPAAAEQTPVSQADYELQAAAELAAQQPVEDDIPDFTPPTTLPQQAAAVAPAVQSPAQPVGTLAKAAQVLNPYSQLATTPFAQAPDQQPIMPDAPVVRGAGLGLNTLQAPSEQEQAQAWAEQQLASPATSRFERQNLQTLAKSPGQIELVRYWRSFQNRQQQPRITPAAGGLTMPGAAGKPLSLAPSVARDSATLPAVPAAVAPAEVQQPPAPVAEAPSSPAAAGAVDQQAMIAKVDARITNLIDLVKKGKHTPQSAFDLLYAMPEYKQLSLHPVEVGNVKFGIDGNAEDLIFAAFEQAAQQKTVNKETVPALTEGNKPKQNTRRQLDPANDDLIVAIGKLGGMDKAQVEQQWGATIADSAKDLHAHASRQGVGFLQPISRKGKPLDEIRRSLEQHGYLPEGSSINDLLAKIDSHLRGKTTYSNQHVGTVQDQDLSVAPDGVEESDYPFDLEGINFPRKNQKHLAFLKRKLAEAKHPNDKKKYRDTLQQYLEKHRQPVPTLIEENKQVLADADLDLLKKGEVVTHSRNGIKYQFVGVDQDRSGNKGLLVKQIRQDGTVADAKSYLPLSVGLIREKTDPVSEVAPAPTIAPDAKTAEKRKGEVGMKLEAGERVLTASGRLTTEFPKINLATNKTAANTLKRVDQWLMDNAIEEARSRGDKFNQLQFAANREKPSQADKDSAEQYLFGEKQLQNKSASAIVEDGGTNNENTAQVVTGSPGVSAGTQPDSAREYLENAASHARGVHGAVRTAERQEAPAPGQVELKGTQKDHYAAIKAKEVEALKQLMEDAGQFPADGFVVAWKSQGKPGETEHKIAVAPDKKTIRKFGNAAVNHTWADYLDRIQAHNQLFIDTLYTFKGLSEIDGELHSVIDQPYIHGDHIEKAPVEVIDKHMAGLGFKPFVRPQFAGKPTEVTAMARLWVHPVSKVAVWDVRPANVLYDTDLKVAHFIDPMIEHLSADFDLSTLTPLDIAPDGTVTGSKFQMVDGEVVPVDPTPESAPASPVPTAARNSKGNIELKFEARPDDAVIERLTSAGFKFNQKQKVWYAPDTADSAKLAEDLSGSTLEIPDDQFVESEPISPRVQKLTDILASLDNLTGREESAVIDKMISGEIYEEIKPYDNHLAYKLMKKGEDGIPALLALNSGKKSNKDAIYQSQANDFKATLQEAIDLLTAKDAERAKLAKEMEQPAASKQADEQPAPIPAQLRYAYNSLPDPATSYFKQLYQALKEKLHTGEFFYNDQLQKATEDSIAADIAETQPRELDITGIEWGKSRNEAMQQFKDSIHSAPRGTWGIVTEQRDNGDVLHFTYMSNGSKQGSLSSNDVYRQQDDGKPTFVKVLARTHEGEVANMRKIVEYELETVKDQQAAATSKLKVGDSFRDLKLPGEKPFSTATITALKDGKATLLVSRRGTKTKWEWSTSIRNLETVLEGQGKLPQQTAVSTDALTDTFGVQPEPEATTPEPAEPAKLDDFGEKLGGAKKDRQPSLDVELSDDDIATKTLSEIWPRKELDAIEDVAMAAFATAARAEIPAKPKNSYKLSRWVGQVKAVRGLVQHAARLGIDAFYETMVTNHPVLNSFVAKARLMEQLPRAEWNRIGKVEEYPHAYRFDENGNKVNAGYSAIVIDGKRHHMDTGVIAEHLDKIEALLEVEAQPKKMQFELRHNTRTGEAYINKKGDPLYRALKTFETVEEGRKFMKSNYADLVAAWENLKERENVKETDTRSAENRPRQGADYREGKDATPEMFSSRFGFRGVEFGTWVSQGKGKSDRQGMLNAAYDALMDLASILNLPPKALSLNGTLGLGFGSRGSGWASAHYEPDTLVINLTKTRGAGSLAHELFHAMDNYFAHMRGGEVKFTGNQEQYRKDNYITYKPEPLYVHKTQRSTPVTKARLEEIHKSNPKSGYYNPGNWQVDPNHPEGVRPEVEAAFADLVQALDESPMSKRAELIDKGKSGGYWSRIIERAARSFENYIIYKMQQQGYHNDYLANVVTAEEFTRDLGRYPYLMDTELAPVVEAFDNLFGTIKTKETDKGVALYASMDSNTHQVEKGAGNETIVSPDRRTETDRGDGRAVPATDAELKIAIATAGKLTEDQADQVVISQADKQLQQIAGLFGKQVVVYQMPEDGKDPGGFWQPALQDYIFISTQSTQPHFVVLGHELMHSLKREAPDLYKEMLRLNLTQQAIDETRKAAERSYGRKVSGPEVTEEALGNYLSMKFTDFRFWEGLSRQAPNLFEKAITVARALVRRVLDAIGGTYKSDHYFNDIRKADRVMTNVVATYARRAGNGALKRIDKGTDEAVKNLSAWHGSPHDHDKFSTDKIGTGEGAQAYGWGLYFAGAREVAEWYRKALANYPNRELAADLKSLNRNAYDAVSTALGRDDFVNASDSLIGSVVQEIISGPISNKTIVMLGDDFGLVRDAALGLEKRGRLYKVELAPAEDEYLLWDKPLSEQSEKVKVALKDELEFLEFDYSDSPANPLKMSGAEFYRGLPKESDRAASEYLHSLGIRGIKYLDGTSRTMADLQIEEGEYLNGEPRYTINGPNGDVDFNTKADAQEYIEKYQEKLNYNYVIFNDADVTIVTKFSLNDDTESFTGLQAADVRKVMPWVNVVQSVNEVPEKVLADATAMGAKPWNIEGFIYEDKVWLVAENIKSISRAKVVAHVHELAHLGQDDKLVDLAVDWFNSTKGDATPFRQETHALLQEEAAKRNLDLNKPEDHRTAVREATARLAEDMAAKGLKPGLIQKIVNHLRELLRKLGRPLRVTDQELAGAVAEMLRLGEKRLSGADYSLQENRLNGQPTSGMIKEKEQDNGTESRNNAGNNSFFGKAQASHFKDAKALSGGIYFSIPEDARRSEVRDKETRALKEFAEQNGLMLDAAPMEREIELQGISGMDNFVYHKDGTYIKANKFTHAGTFSDLFVNITLHNKVFPEAPYIFEGFVNIHGMFRPVFSQPAFANDMAGEDQRRDLERLAADTLVSRDNFTRIDGDFKIVAQASFTRNDIVVSDINYRNVLHFNDEVIYFDPIVRLSDAARTRENLQSLLFDDQPSVQFSLRSEIQDAVKSIPWEDVVPTTKENWRRFFNPLDWSRSWGVIQDLTPEVIQAAIGDFFATPIAQAERDPAKAPYVAEGDARETDRMQIMLDMFDFNPGQKDTRSPKEKIVDAFTKLHSGQINTEWEKLNQRLFALKDLQRKAFDLIFVEGDAMGSEYASLAVARLNPRLAKAPGMNAEVFELYRDIRHHMDVTVAEARIKHMEELLKLMPEMTDKERERHIAEYRNQLRKVRGWMTRDHGKGRFQATVYHVFTAAELAEDWKAKELFDKDGEPSGMQYVLPYYPGNRVMEIIENRVKEGWQEAKAKVTTTDKGLVVITLTGAAESAMEDLGSVIDEQMKDNPIKVMTYMHRFETKLGAKAHRNLVAKDLKKAMPRTYIEGHRYEVAPVMVADDLSEELFQAVKGDIALEQILKKSLDNALKRGEIDKEKHTALHNELVQDVAEVLLSRAAGRYQIRRAPYLIEGYATEGVMSLYQDYITGVAGMLSKAKYAMKQYKHLEEAKAEVKPWATAYVFDTLRNMGLADRIGGDVRALASLWLMGFKLSSAMINATQPYTLGLAELKRRIPGQSAIKLITQAQGNIFTGKGLQQDEEAIFETAVYKHQEMIDAVSEVSGHNEGSFTKAGKLLHGLTGKSLALFQQVEILNRKTMILAAYRAYRAEGTPRGLIDEAALKMAMEVNSAVNFEMGRHNLPGFARKSAAGRTLYALQPYAWNSLNLIFNRLTSGETRDQIALLRYAGMMFLLAGATGLPGGDELDKLYRRLRGRSIKLDLQEWSAKHAAEYGTIGEMANGFAWYGMPSLVGINASNAMRLQMPIVSQLLADNSALEAVTGVPGALWNKMTTAATFAGRGAPMRAVEAAAPEFVAGPLRAARMYREGATTSHGKRIFDEEGQPLQYSAGDAVKRGLGFQPLKQSQRSALTEQMQALEKYWGKDQKDLIDAIRFAKDDDARDKAIDKVQEYNERLLESQALGLVTPITDSKIRNGLTYKPNRKQTGWKQQHSN